ncbi:MAG: hypothetical protein NVS4B7_17920 [Ktedonobacteraceae bacterium]
MSETVNTNNHHRPVGVALVHPVRGRGNPLLALILFSTWSLRQRAGQMLPVAIAFLLLVSTIQTIGTLHDISSVATQQQIARSWHGPYDLLIRPQSAVSSLERSAGWIDAQTMLENYGGINDKQVASIRTLPHVTVVSPVANLGWQSIAVQIPVTLSSKGVYRLSATWIGQNPPTTAVTQYVDVSDLNMLTTELPPNNPVITHLIISNNVTSVVFPTSIQTLQAVIGISATQQTMLSQTLTESIPPASALHFSIHVDRLIGNLNMLAMCLHKSSCWTAQPVHQGAATYRPDGVQLLRYSHANYTATSQQLTAGQIIVRSFGTDVQGALYRHQLSTTIAVPFNQLSYTRANPLHVVPSSAPAHLPILTSAMRFIPLEQACAINGPNCYSGLYVQLNGVETYSQSSVAILQATAAAITTRTGLHVDILDGSSLRTVSLTTASPDFHQTIPSLWRVVGVAVQLVHGLDAIQQILLVLCSIVCLLAIGTSGVLVGIGHRKETLLLQQLGWQRYLLASFLILDAFFLCGPGCLLAISWIIIMSAFWPNSLPPESVWLLLIIGILVYCCTLVSIAYAASNQSMTKPQRNIHFIHRKVTVPWVLGLALFSAVFLIVMEYLLFTNFNQVLVVTVLGNQVRTALETPQLALMLLIFLSACLTVGLCATLILRGRREEISLLARVGWQQRDVLLRVMRDNWSIALLSGEVGVVLALGIAILGDALPSVVSVISLLICGPLAGLLLVNVAALGPSWYETKRVFV